MMACAIQVRHGGGFSSCKKIFSEVKGENKIPKARDGDVSAVRVETWTSLESLLSFPFAGIVYSKKGY